MLWFLLCFCNSVELKPGTYVNALTFDINMNWSTFLYLYCFIYFVIVIYTVFAKINMQILPSFLLLYVIMVKGIVQPNSVFLLSNKLLQMFFFVN